MHRTGGRWLLLLPAALACAPRAVAEQPESPEPCDPCFVEVRNSTDYRLELSMGGPVAVLEPRGVAQFTVDGPLRTLVGTYYNNSQPVARRCEFRGERDGVLRYECRRR